MSQKSRVLDFSGLSKTESQPLVKDSTLIPMQKFKLKEKKPVGLKKLYSSVFEIYGIGINYNTNNGYGLPIGSGFMITDHLIITTHRVIPTSEHALISIIKFPNSPNSTFRLDPNGFFYTDSAKNITISGILIPLISFPINFLETRYKFKLYKGEVVRVLENLSVPLIVTNIASNSFSFKYSESLLPGAPIFSYNYKLQGIYSSSQNSISIKDAIRIDIIMNSLIRIKNLLLHPELENLLSEYVKSYNIPVFIGNRLGECRDLYCLENNTFNVFHYQYTSRVWEKLQILNISHFKSSQNTVFYDNCRLAYCHDGSFLVTGGFDKQNRRVLRDVIQVYPSSGVMSKKSSMQEGRFGHCLVYRIGFIYAIGGIPRLNTCERYNLHEDKWEPIGSLVKGRSESSACTFLYENYIMIIGGGGEASNTIEKYSFQYDKWELLTILLPYDFINAGVYLFQHNSIAIFGGRKSDSVLIVEQESFDRENIEEVYKVYQVDVLQLKLVTFYPCVYLEGKNVIHFLNDKGLAMPEIFEFSVKKLGGPSIGPVTTFKNTSRIRQNIPNTNRLLTPSYFDNYF